MEGNISREVNGVRMERLFLSLISPFLSKMLLNLPSLPLPTTVFNFGHNRWVGNGFGFFPTFGFLSRKSCGCFYLFFFFNLREALSWLCFCSVPQRGHSFAWRVKRSFQCKGHADVAEAASKQNLRRAQSSSQRSEKEDNHLVCLLHSNLYQI